MRRIESWGFPRWHQWFTVTAGRTNARGEWWLKLGPVSFAGYEWDGVRSGSLHIANRWYCTLWGKP